MNFIPGLQLNEGFYREIVAALLAEHFPSIRYSAALMGYGSDVLGFDTAISMDHNWGPRMQIFLSSDDLIAHGRDIVDCFQFNLPFQYMGFPTNFCTPRYDGTQSMEETTRRPINHLIEVTSVESYFKDYLGLDSVDDVAPIEWTRLEDQKLLEVTSGEVFHDGLGYLTETRRRFAFYPMDVLLFRLAKLWKTIEENEPLVGKTIELKTYDGTKILAAVLVETCIKVCMYLGGKYLPYRKWLFRSFQTTRVYPEVYPLCMNVLSETLPGAIEDQLCKLYEKVVEIHNRDVRLPRLENRTRYFFNRPYKVIFAESIMEKLRAQISNPEIAGLLWPKDNKKRKEAFGWS
jgi:hypothetical protein